MLMVMIVCAVFKDPFFKAAPLPFRRSGTHGQYYLLKMKNLLKIGGLGDPMQGPKPFHRIYNQHCKLSITSKYFKADY